MPRNNLQIINDAFAGMRARERRRSLDAMLKGMEKGYKTSVDIHEERHLMLHLENSGDLGYAVVQDGQEKRTELVEGNRNSLRTAEEMLAFEHIPSAPDRGVLGVMSAGMISSPYKDTHETDIMEASFEDAVARTRKELLK